MSLGVRCIELTQTHEGLDLHQAMTWIGQDGIHDLWVEAGGKCFASLVHHKLVQRAIIYISLRWINHGKMTFPTGISLDKMSQIITWRQFDNDVLCDIQF